MIRRIYIQPPTRRVLIQIGGQRRVVSVVRERVRVVRIGFQQQSSGGGTAYNHTQSSAATTWTINHNLGYKPVVSVFTTGGSEVEAEVLHASTNQTLIYLAFAMAGSARLI